jgi:hypothetical protein
MNARCTPSLVLANHTENQLAHFPADASSSHAGLMPREQRPIQLEACAMPANYCLRLDENQCPLPSGPELLKHHPEQFVGNGKSRLRTPTFQNSDLLPKSQVFHEQVAARAKDLSRQNEKKSQQAQNETSFTLKYA